MSPSRPPLSPLSGLFLLGLLGLVGASALGCGGDRKPVANTALTTPTSASPTADTTLVPAGSAGSKKADRMANPAWAPCHASYKIASQDMSREATKLGEGCAAVSKMHPLGDPFKGSQSASNAAQVFKFKAQGQHCYRAYGASAGGITDLDVLIKDSDGAVAGEDSTDDPTPVVLEDGAVCFKADDDASVVVSVGSGQGDYAVQVWGN